MMNPEFKVPYGIADFSVIRRNQYLYIDKTRYIGLLEDIGRYLFFIRPRRFGKSLLLSTLEHYYDVRQRDSFDKLFSGLYISQHPTALKNSYFVLKFNFSGLDTSSEMDLRGSFINAVRSQVLGFVAYYEKYLADVEEILSDLKESADLREILDTLFNAVRRTEYKVYLIIDEYDHFANDIIAMGDGEYYKNIIRTRGFVRDFFETIKIWTQGTIDRIFITGISPIMLDDLTSGFNIASNITTLSLVNEMLGFTESEVEQVIAHSGYAGDRQALLTKLRAYYDGYWFSPKSAYKLYNPDMVLYFFDQLRLTGEFPVRLIDDNVKMDYDRLNRLIANPKNYDILDSIVKSEEISSEIVARFSFDRMYDPRYFVSLLFYLGLLTLHGTQYGMTVLGIPNFVIRTLYWELISERLRVDYQIHYDTVELQKAVWQMAFEGKIEPYLQFISEKVLKVLSNRDLIQFDEKYVKLLLFSFLVPSNIYKPVSEREVENGYIDIYIEKDIRNPDVKYEWLWELKYLKKEDVKQLERVKEEGLQQLRRYAASEKFRDVSGLKKALVICVGKDEFVTVVE